MPQDENEILFVFCCVVVDAVVVFAVSLFQHSVRSSNATKYFAINFDDELSGRLIQHSHLLR